MTVPTDTELKAALEGKEALRQALWKLARACVPAGGHGSKAPDSKLVTASLELALVSAETATRPAPLPVAGGEGELLRTVAKVAAALEADSLAVRHDTWKQACDRYASMLRAALASTAPGNGEAAEAERDFIWKAYRYFSQFPMSELAQASKELVELMNEADAKWGQSKREAERVLARAALSNAAPSGWRPIAEAVCEVCGEIKGWWWHDEKRPLIRQQSKYHAFQPTPFPPTQETETP